MLTPEPAGQKELAMTTNIAADRLDFLRQVPAFHHLGARDLTLIDALVDDVSVEPGRVLAREGATGRGMFVVVSGMAEVSAGGQTVGVLGPGSFMGDSETFDLRPDRFTVTARTLMRLLVVGPAAFATFLEQRGVAVAVMKGLFERQRSPAVAA
jgi:CRP-like cAMP-binding protein